MSVSTIIVDFDGTLLDALPRHYGCYAAIMRELAQAPLPIEEYWALKRRAMDARGVLRQTGSDALTDQYTRRWLSLIESAAMLTLDVAHAGAVEALRAWSAQGASLVLTSLRQFPHLLDSQLKALGIGDLFPRRAVASPFSGAKGKAESVRLLVDPSELDHSVWIGDTEADVSGARLVGCRAWAVSCGIRSAAFLRTLGAEQLADSLADLDPFGIHAVATQRAL